MHPSIVTTLAQIPGLSTQPPPAPLPEPSILQWALFENPWAGSGILLLPAAIAYFSLSRSGKEQLARRIAGLLTLAAVAAAACALLVETTRERLIAQTSTLIHAAARADTAVVEPLLASDIRLRILGTDSRWDRAQMLDALQRRLKKEGGDLALKEHAVLAVQAVVDGPNAARTQVRVRATPEAWGVPNTSWWKLTWRLDPAGTWRVVDAEALQIDGVSPGQADRDIGR